MSRLLSVSTTYLKLSVLYASDADAIRCAVAALPIPALNRGAIGSMFKMFPVKMNVLDALVDNSRKPLTASLAAAKTLTQLMERSLLKLE